MSALDRFLSGAAGAWSKDLWDGLIRAVDARFAPLEEQLDIQRETTDRIVSRGLQIINDELTPVLDHADDVKTAIDATKTSADETAALIAAIYARLLVDLVPAEAITTNAGRRFTSDSEMNAKAPLASPALTGAPTAPTPSGGDNTTKIATTAFVKAAIDALLSGAPGALDTLDELAAALGDDANFASTVTAALAARLRFDAAQTLSGGEKTQALSNLGTGVAAASDVRAGTDDAKFVTSKALMDAAIEQTLTDAATIAWDMSLGFTAKCTLGGNRTLGQPTNAKAGMTYVFRPIQDGSGNRTLAYHACWGWGLAGAPTITATANKHDIVMAYCRVGGATPAFNCSILKGYG